MKEKQSTWGQKAGVASGSADATGEGNFLKSPISIHHPGGHNPRVACEHCDMFNHLSKDCRKNVCEICGFNNHSTYDCKRCVS